MMMRPCHLLTIGAILGFVLAPARATGQARGEFVAVPSAVDSTYVIILPDSAGLRFATPDSAASIRGCRLWPGRRTGVWRVDAATVVALDSIVVEVAQRALQAMEPYPPGPTLEFFRQYAGVEISGRRLVYVNALDARVERRRRELSSRYSPTNARDEAGRLLEHASYPIVAADGGASNWGLLIDPMSRRAGGVAVNCGFDHRTPDPIGGPLVPPTA